MRRREKFILVSFILTIGLFFVQVSDIEYRYISVFIFTIISYFLSAFALKEDLDSYEWYTILPLPTMYTLSTSLFYFLLPDNIVNQIILFVVFFIGFYALLLTGNIFSVAKGRTIQLLYAAHSVELLFDLFISLLLVNTIFSLMLSPIFIFLLVFIVHFVLLYISFWSIKLENKVSREVLEYSFITSLFLAEFATLMSFLPFPIWHTSLFIMLFLYIAINVIKAFISEKIYEGFLKEYFFSFIMLCVIFLILFPYK